MAQAYKSALVSESQAMLLFLGLLLVAPLLGRPIDHSSKKFMASSSATTTELHPQQTKHTLPPPSSSAAAATAATTSTTTTTTTTISGSASGEQFKAAAHEVPSGPNPESN
ncbi:hypothetical protein P3X46_006414 [Hevea brasiliensis]|uniref:Uncharacterized protein n=1 Tax=Hevea brasiliensis TaxID=3981 RepID=A0ABQ9MR49_HEVBR|nr:CLAVATA3/ESR (CLE)-related protein TDIF-like [Hevea brasiliensis]KAJ9182418.1 hypothetical protein P3X46_006414 [Hevea brasiliensis]